MFFDTGEIPVNTHPGRVKVHTGDQTRTVQSAREDADINVIVRRMMRTGNMPINARVPTAGDFSAQVTDYHTAMNMLRTAQDEFYKLPSRVRSRFQNDPQELMDFLADPQNNDESYKLGLRIKPRVEEPEAPIKVEVVSAAAPSTPKSGT